MATLVLQPGPEGKDTWVQADGGNRGPNDTWLRTGNDSDSSTLRRSFIQFDLSSLPAGSTITSATLRLVCVYVNAGAGGAQRTVTIQRCTSAWNEDIYWGGQPAMTATGEVVTQQQFLNDSAYTWTVTSIAQGWLSSGNHGLGILCDENLLYTDLAWASGDHATVSSRPQLTITYNAPPSQPGAFTSPTSGAVVNTTATVAAGAASDPDGDALQYQWDLSLNGGASYVNKRATQAGLSWTYDYTNEPETSNAIWRVRAWDGQAWGPYTYSSEFTISHGLYVPAVML